MTSADLTVRPRQTSDLPALLMLLQRTHEQDGYPVRASAVRADWLAAPDELIGAVAEHRGRVVGHVALHPTAVPGHDEVHDEGHDEGHDPGQEAAAALWQQATGLPAERLAVISRLLTDGSVKGAGTALLAHAVRGAAQLGRAPVLLVDPDSRARGFYLRRGWTEVGTARQQWGHRSVDAALLVLANPS